MSHSSFPDLQIARQLCRTLATSRGMPQDTALISRILDALDRAENQMQRQYYILDQIHDSVITMDLDGFITGWNKGAERLFGYTEEEVLGHHILFLYADEQEEDELFNAFLENGAREFEVRRRKKSGEVFWASITLSLVRNEAGKPTGIIGYLVDITERLSTAERLRLHAKIFEHNSEAVLVTDAQWRILSTNRAFTTITGWQESDVLGKLPTMIEPVERDPQLKAEVETALDSASGTWQGELWDRRRGDELFPAWVSLSAVRGPRGELSHRFMVFSDITERKEAERQIYRLAYYDALTGLPNRSLLFSLLEQALAEAHRGRLHGALLFLDLNRFKNVNDSFGHHAADTLLREVAQRLTTALRREDVVARLGGDEFVIALFDIKEREHAGIVAQKLLDALGAPIQVGAHEVMISASIGIAIFPEDGRDSETLIRHADVAMYRAKQSGSHGFLFYSQEMNLRSLERLKMEGGLKRALEREEFTLFYQPQLDLTSGRIVGAEALLRWRHPERGMVGPGEFIAIAEETGLIIPIGEWVLDAACAQARLWRDAGIPVRVAVNLSSRQFRPTLPEQIARFLGHHGISGDLLELEITESILMHNGEQAVSLVERLREAGILLSLDDFGTGYSSLAYLKRFPVDNLKIDQSFIAGLPEDGSDAAIVRAIIGIARNLGRCVIAEGVETEAQQAFLRDAGCDEIQGFLFSRPLPAPEFGQLLARTNGVGTTR